MVGQRYKNFKALRDFVHNQLTEESARTQPHAFKLPDFPGQRIPYLFRQQALERRRLGLEEFLNYLVDNKAFGNPHVADAVFAFLEVTTVPPHIAPLSNIGDLGFRSPRLPKPFEMILKGWKWRGWQDCNNVEWHQTYLSTPSEKIGERGYKETSRS